MWWSSAAPPPPPPPPPSFLSLLLPWSQSITVAVVIIVCLRVILVPPVELARKILTALYHVQGVLPAPLAKSWRLVITLAFQAIPGVDPSKDSYITTYSLPAVVKGVAPASEDTRKGALITGVTGFVGLHLLDYLLRTTDARVFILVRKRSLGKLRQEAQRYKLSLPGFEERVRLLEGDCKRADLGLSAGNWEQLATEVRHVFHLAANSSFVATYEVLRGDWLGSFARLLEFCAAHAVGFHMIGSVGRFAINAHPTRRGVWTSGYMRCKAVQFALVERFRQRGLTTSWVDCAYVIGSLESGGVNPGFHDSMWKAAAIQRAVGVGFPGDATLVPVDLLVQGVHMNATQPCAELTAPYMALRLQSILTSEAIGISTTVSAAEFRVAAAKAGFSPTVINAFVPLDIGELVDIMHRPLEAPPAVAALFERVDEAAILAANFEYACSRG